LDTFPKLDGLQTLLEKIERERSLNFRGYKRSSLIRRIGRRMRLSHPDLMDDYLRLLDVSPSEFSHLLDDLTIKYTEFFRDPPVFSLIAQQILPKLFTHKGTQIPLRVWSVGCSSGEETYSLAILIADLLGPNRPRYKIKIYGTDIDQKVVEQARSGVYKPYRLESLCNRHLSHFQKYSTGSPSYYRVAFPLRNLVVFGCHNLLSDPPISHIDLLICRNVLIYFERELQERFFHLFHYALDRSGFLVLGKAEQISPQRTADFKEIDRQLRIYQKR
jgi:two-component system CheB/CheR fusion protein